MKNAKGHNLYMLVVIRRLRLITYKIHTNNIIFTHTNIFIFFYIYKDIGFKRVTKIFVAGLKIIIYLR